MRAVPVVLAVTTIAWAGLTGCSHDDRATPADAPPAKVAPVDAMPAPIRDASIVSTNDHLFPMRDAGPLPPCRVIGVIDAGMATSKSLEPGWIRLGEGASFTVRHPKSLRETTFTGPGEVRPCVEGRELHEVRLGGFVSVPGSGESPGHEAWVVTPLGVVRYVAAGLKVDVSGGNASANGAPGVSVRVNSGEARVWHAGPASATVDKPPASDDDAGRSGAVGRYDWTLLPAGGAMSLTLGRIGHGAPPLQMSLYTECLDDAHEAAARARALSGAVTNADAGADFGTRAALHMGAFDAARAACATARLEDQCAAGSGGARDGGLCAGDASAHDAVIDRVMLWAELGQEPPP